MAAMKNDVNGPLMLTIGAISALLLVVATVAVDGWYKSVEAEEIASKWQQNPNAWLENLHNQEKANINDEHQINPRHYRLSIDDAMKVVAERKGKISE
jgi:hypothetical protein